MTTLSSYGVSGMPWVAPTDLHLTESERMDLLDGKAIAVQHEEGVLVVNPHRSGQSMDQLYGSFASHPDQPGWGFLHIGGKLGSGADKL